MHISMLILCQTIPLNPVKTHGTKWKQRFSYEEVHFDKCVWVNKAQRKRENLQLPSLTSWHVFAKTPSNNDISFKLVNLPILLITWHVVTNILGKMVEKVGKNQAASVLLDALFTWAMMGMAFLEVREKLNILQRSLFSFYAMKKRHLPGR